METKLDLILLEELARKYGAAIGYGLPNDKGYNNTLYILYIGDKNPSIESHNKLEICMKEYPSENKIKTIQLFLYNKDKNSRKLLLDYIRRDTLSKDKPLFLTAKNYKNCKYYLNNDTIINELNSGNRGLKKLNRTLNDFIYNKEKSKAL